MLACRATLHTAQVRTAFQDVRGHGVPQRMGRHRAATGRTGGSLHHPTRHPRIEPPAATAEEERIAAGRNHPMPASRGRATVRPPGPPAPHRHHPATTALPMHPQGVAGEVAEIEPARLRHPQAAAVEQLHQSHIPQPFRIVGRRCGGVEQRGDLGRPRHCRQALLPHRTAQSASGSPARRPSRCAHAVNERAAAARRADEARADPDRERCAIQARRRSRSTAERSAASSIDPNRSSEVTSAR